MTARACLACGATGTGRFCRECGASLDDCGAPTRQALREDAADVVGFDRRLIATLRDLLLHPVRVVQASMTGDRRTYVPPLKLFLALGGIYMVALSVVQPFRFDPAALHAGGGRSDTAARMEQGIRGSGLSEELFAERFQARTNTLVPVVAALALLPIAALLRVFDRRRPWSQHLLFILAASNGVWLLSLLCVPIAFASVTRHAEVTTVILYAYRGIVFFALYRAGSMAATVARFALFVVIDLVLSLTLSVVVFVLVYRSVLLI